MANYEGNRPRLVVPPIERNPRTGLPEQYFYRPPTPKNIQAAKNGLIGLLVIGAIAALPWWAALLQEWSKR